MDNVIVDTSVAVLGAPVVEARRSRFDDILARHRQRRLEALALWAAALAVIASLSLV